MKKEYKPKLLIIIGTIMMTIIMFFLVFKINSFKNNNKSNEIDTLANNKITISFNGNGGSVSRKSLSIKKGNKISNLPTATRKGYTFNGWYTASSGGIRVYNGTVFYGNKTLYAHWAAKPVAVSKVKLSNTNVKLIIGYTMQLSLSITPSNATNKNVTWSSSNTSVVTVTQGGLIKAIKEGTATITVTSNNGKKATCKVTVSKPIAVNKITLNKSSMNLNSGSSGKLNVTISPTNATNKYISWRSSNTNVASVDQNGLVIAKTAGTAVITATSSNGKTATCNVKVKNVACKISSDPIDSSYNSCFSYSHSLGVSTKSITIGVGESKTISVSLPRECGTFIRYTRQSADGASGWSNYVSQSRTNINSSGFTWVITGKKRGSTVISQTVQYDAKSPSGKCSGNVKSMITVSVKVN